MTTKREQRQIEVDDLRHTVRSHCLAIQALAESLPTDANLAVHRAIRNSVARCLDEVSGYVGRENARREARDGRP